MTFDTVLKNVPGIMVTSIWISEIINKPFIQKTALITSVFLTQNRFNNYLKKTLPTKPSGQVMASVMCVEWLRSRNDLSVITAATTATIFVAISRFEKRGLKGIGLGVFLGLIGGNIWNRLDSWFFR
jgi:hypothetical protein